MVLDLISLLLLFFLTYSALDTNWQGNIFLLRNSNANLLGGNHVLSILCITGFGWYYLITSLRKESYKVLMISYAVIPVLGIASMHEIVFELIRNFKFDIYSYLVPTYLEQIGLVIITVMWVKKKILLVPLAFISCYEFIGLILKIPETSLVRNTVTNFQLLPNIFEILGWYGIFVAYFIGKRLYETQKSKIPNESILSGNIS